MPALHFTVSKLSPLQPTIKLGKMFLVVTNLWPGSQLQLFPMALDNFLNKALVERSINSTERQ